MRPKFETFEKFEKYWGGGAFETEAHRFENLNLKNPGVHMFQIFQFVYLVTTTLNLVDLPSSSNNSNI